MDPVTLKVLAVVFLASLVRGFLGFGNALVAMPLLALFLNIRTVAPLVALLSFVKALIMLAQSWRHICVKSTWRMLAATAFGTPLGLLFLKGAHQQVVQLVLALVIALFSLYSLFRPSLVRLRSDRGAYVAGFFAGILGGAYNANGPPIVMYGTMRGWSPEQFKATLQGFFLPAGVLILIGHAAAGLWTAEVFRYLAWSIPVVVVTLLVSQKLSTRIPQGKFDKVVHVSLLVVAAILAAKAIS